MIHETWAFDTQSPAKAGQSSALCSSRLEGLGTGGGVHHAGSVQGEGGCGIVVVVQWGSQGA